MNKQARRVAFALAIAATAASAASCTVAAPAKPTMVVYGDSLTAMSEGATDFLYGAKYRIVWRAWGGTALCDWSSRAVADRIIYRPARVVVAFTGNTATCAASSWLDGGATGAVANYKQALGQMATAYRGVPISVVGAPAMRDTIGWFPFNGSAALNAMYRSESARLGLSYNAGADTSLTPGHVWRTSGPTFVHGPVVVLRTADGIHLSSAGEMWYAAIIGS